MANDNENDNSSNNETTAEAETASETSNEGLDAAALQEKLKETEAKNRQLFERAKRAEGFEFDKDSKRWYKPEKHVPAKEETKVAPEAQTGELSEAQQDFFELKGYSEPEQVEVFAQIMRRTGMSHREVIKDEYALAKVKDIQERKKNLAATPSSQRAGQAGNDRLDLAIGEYERTQKLPDNFDLRVKVIDAVASKHSASTPPWRR